MKSNDFVKAPQVTTARLDFYDRLSNKSTLPLWEVLNGVVSPTPKTDAVPHVWRYDELRPLVLEGASLITAEEAERRVVVLENPGLKGKWTITQCLYAGLQIVMPGEIAPSHRHVAAALRFVIEGEGAYTAVDGERVTMHPGDFVITPSWTFHDHGNPSDKPIIWLDGLDWPMINFMEAGFAEHSPAGDVARVIPEEDSTWRFGQNMLPVE